MIVRLSYSSGVAYHHLRSTLSLRIPIAVYVTTPLLFATNVFLTLCPRQIHLQFSFLVWSCNSTHLHSIFMC